MWRRRNTHLSSLWEMWCYCGWFKVWTAKSWCFCLESGCGHCQETPETGICAVFTSFCVTQNSFTTITRSIFALYVSNQTPCAAISFLTWWIFLWHVFVLVFLLLEVNYFIGDLFLTVSSCTKSDDSMYHKTWCSRGLTNAQTHPVKWSRVTPSVNGHKSLLTNNKSVS